MSFSLRKFFGAVLLAAMPGLAVLAQAQGLRMPGAASPANSDLLAPSLPDSRPPELTRRADHIVAIVNSEPITYNEVQNRLQRLAWQIAQEHGAGAVPPVDVLASEALEQIILEKAQLQLAREQGMKINDLSVDQAVQNMARQNQLSESDLYRELEKEGVSRTRFRAELRNRLMLNRLREEIGNDQARVSEADIDKYLAAHTAQATAAAGRTLLSLEHLLVAVSENADDGQVQQARALAQNLAQRARDGESFDRLADTRLADVRSAVLPPRPESALPELFVKAVAGLKKGEVAEPVQSPAGFHVLRLLERGDAGVPTVVPQTHVRHILLVPDTRQPEAMAIARLEEFRSRIEAGQADFATLARDFSQDGSASGGGDLGWANPGQFVPEFEEAMEHLAPGQISPPVITRFGVHLIQVLERRDMELDRRQQRELARNIVRAQKAQEGYETWLKELRGRAYVELRDAPLDD